MMKRNTLHAVPLTVALCLLPVASCQAQSNRPPAAPASGASAVPIIPPDSAIGRAGSLQRILLSPLESDSPIEKAGWMLKNLAVVPAPKQIVPKIGQTALLLRGDAEQAGAKGDFTVTGALPGNPKFVGIWVYLSPDSNVDRLGFQIHDAEGESLIATIPADWQGWKWVELDLQSPSLTQTYEQAGKNKKVDFPISGVHIAWFAKAAGPSSLAVDALIATTDKNDTRTSVDVQIAGATWGEINTPLAMQQVVLTNYANTPRTIKVDYVVQRDPALYSATPPDPDYGLDHAIGAKSWTEANGKILEKGSLTDAKDWTNALLSWGSHKEAIQYVDLGQERVISRLACMAGDGNWTWKTEFSYSTDGKTYQPIPGLQEFDLHGKWGFQVLPLAQPLTARYLRLRHHNGGQTVNQISMPATLAVYDGVTNEKWAIPVVGETVAKGTLSKNVPANGFDTLAITDNKLLPPGSYLVSARVQDTSSGRTQLIHRHFMVMPKPLPSVANSRFGLNASNYLLAPLHRRLGIGWVRFENLKWPMVSPQPNVYSFKGVLPWNVPHDDVISGYQANGIQFLPFLFLTPDYATSAPDTVKDNRNSYPPKDNAQMADFVFQTVARYGSQKYPATELKTSDKKSGLNQVHVYEIWNEPNLTDPGWGPWVGTTTQYNEMFRASANAVKRADATAKVTNGGFAGIDIETVNTLLIPYADGKKPLDFVDILNVHFYSGRIAPEVSTNDPNADRSGNLQGARTYEEDLRRLIAWRDKNKPGMPIWMTETGYDSAGPFGTDEYTQAARLPRVVMMSLASGIDKVFVYRESGSTASMHAASGVLRNDETLKPSWFTYATLIRELDSVKAKAIRLLYPDPNVFLYAWTRGAETILSAWAIEGTANLNLKLGNSTVTDAFGNARQQNIAGTLPLSVFPVYIKNIGNPAGFKTLVAQAQRTETARRQEQLRLAKRQAYLFDFGSQDKVGTIDIGDTRTFTPVLGTDIYDEKKGYGFFPPAAGADNNRHWISDPLECDSTRMEPAHIFRVNVKPGRYQLRASVHPQDTGELRVKGTIGGDKVLPTTKDSPPVTAQIEVGTEGVSISTTGYSDIHWLTLVEQSQP